MSRRRMQSYRLAPLCTVFLVASLIAGCGYMPRTANQVQADLNARDKVLRDEITTSKEELLARIEEADLRLAGVDTCLADLTASLEEVKNLEATMESVRADMTAVRDDIRRVREDLRASVRMEISEALMDAGRGLQSGGGG